VLDVFLFQAEDGIRDFHVTGVQTCALPISIIVDEHGRARHSRPGWHGGFVEVSGAGVGLTSALQKSASRAGVETRFSSEAIGLRSEERRGGKENGYRGAMM